MSRIISPTIIFLFKLSSLLFIVYCSLPCFDFIEAWHFRVALHPACDRRSLQRSSFVFRERFNLSGSIEDLFAEARDAPAAPAAPGGPFAAAWRNYIKSVFKKGFMYKLSCKPSAILYIADNKTLAGKEDRTYEGGPWGARWLSSSSRTCLGLGAWLRGRIGRPSACSKVS